MNFRRFRTNTGCRPRAGALLTLPLLNVLFLLFFLFACASGNFCRVPLVLNPLLPAGGCNGAGPAFNEVIVRGEGNILLNGTSVSAGEITDRLAACAPGERVLVIKASGKIPLSLLSDVWNRCRRAGAVRMNILTEH